MFNRQGCFHPDASGSGGGEGGRCFPILIEQNSVLVLFPVLPLCSFNLFTASFWASDVDHKTSLSHRRVTCPTNIGDVSVQLQGNVCAMSEKGDAG